MINILLKVSFDLKGYTKKQKNPRLSEDFTQILEGTTYVFTNQFI